MNQLKVFSSILIVMCLFGKSLAQNINSNDPIIGKWYLSAINNTDISAIKCYSDSFLDFKEQEISVYISELKPDETCGIMMESDGMWENKDGVYYVDKVAMDFKITPRGNKLIWMENPELQLVFMKKDANQEVATKE